MPEQQEVPEWLRGYAPPSRLLRSGHVQTVLGNYLKRQHSLPESESVIIQVDPGDAVFPPSSVLCKVNWQADRQSRPTMILVHGLEGSTESHYMLGNAAKAWTAGFNVIRMNMRSCGGTVHLSPTVYHCGLSGDVGAVVDYAIHTTGHRYIALVGYSMGGNLVLKYLGENPDEAFRKVMAAVGVSPATDLALCSDALHEWKNRAYEWKFLQQLRAHYQQKCAAWPAIYDPTALDRARSLRDFDTAVVARYAGFADASDYYARAQSANVVQNIRVPTLVLHALDDPFIRMSGETRDKLMKNRAVTLVETQHGGHCAFLSKNGTDTDLYWAEHRLLRFLLQMTPKSRAGESSVEDAQASPVQYRQAGE